MTECVLCAGPGGHVVWEDDLCRVVVPDEPAHPGLVRVVLHSHVVEMTDLTPRESQGLLSMVLVVEAALLGILTPDKINLASLGNLVPHLHWHVIPRWRDDPWFPGAIWAPAVRAAPARALPPDFVARLGAALA